MKEKKRLRYRAYIFLILIALILWNEGLLEDWVFVLQKFFFNQINNLKNFSKDLRDFFTIYESLQEEKEYWKKETERLYKENVNLKLILENIKRNENFLWIKDIKIDNYSLIPAVIISRDVISWYTNFRINKGKKDGIKENMPVLYEDQLIGKIDRVYNNFSDVKTIYDPSFSVGVIIYETRDQGIVKGNIDHIELLYLFSDNGIKNGFKVITSGIDDGIPYGLKVGYISELNKDSILILPKVIITPFFDISKIEGVIVCKTY